MGEGERDIAGIAPPERAEDRLSGLSLAALKEASRLEGLRAIVVEERRGAGSGLTLRRARTGDRREREEEEREPRALHHARPTLVDCSLRVKRERDPITH